MEKEMTFGNIKWFPSFCCLNSIQMCVCVCIVTTDRLIPHLWKWLSCILSKYRFLFGTEKGQLESLEILVHKPTSQSCVMLDLEAGWRSEIDWWGRWSSGNPVHHSPVPFPLLLDSPGEGGTYLMINSFGGKPKSFLWGCVSIQAHFTGSKLRHGMVKWLTPGSRFRLHTQADLLQEAGFHPGLGRRVWGHGSSSSKGSG